MQAAFIGVFLFTLLMMSREGMESALLLIQLRGTAHLAMGAAMGLAGAAALAWLWSRYGRHVNLALFFQVTAVFLIVFVVQLLIYGFHETAEQNFLPYSEAIHAATESWGPDSGFGHLLTYLLVMLPLGWLLVGLSLHEIRQIERACGAFAGAHAGRQEALYNRRVSSPRTADPPRTPEARKRLRYIDWARGVAVLVMIEAHTFDAWTRLPDRSSHAFKNLIFVGGFAAPLFLWLAGLAVALSAERALQRTGDRRAAASAVCKRGLEIFILAFLFRLQAFIVSPGSALVTIFRWTS